MGMGNCIAGMEDEDWEWVGMMLTLLIEGGKDDRVNLCQEMIRVGQVSAISIWPGYSTTPVSVGCLTERSVEERDEDK